MNLILEQDINELIHDTSIDWEALNGRNVFITGGTGLVGTWLVRTFLKLNYQKNANITIHMLVSSIEKAKNITGTHKSIIYHEGRIEGLEELPEAIDYVFHLASPTSSRYFIEKPVETIDTIVNGTKIILDLCRRRKIKKFLYFSSMEMYGVLNKEKVSETDLGYINNLNVRSCYSEGKRAAEMLCYCYMKEYGVPCSIIRLAMCFGSGISKNETRVYKAFIDAGLAGKAVEVKSAGTTPVNFIYTKDAVKGIITVLIKGEDGEAYNVSADESGMTILSMAHFIADQCGVSVDHNIPADNQGFAPDNQMTLDNVKLKRIGWEPEYDIKAAIVRTINYIKEGC